MNIFLRNAAIILFIVCSSGMTAHADDAWIATHNLMPGDILRNDDIDSQPQPRPVADALPAARPIAGLEVKRRVYQGHVIATRDVGAPIVVKANMPVEVHWQSGSLTLIMQGNAMDPGAVGDQIRVLNPATSRAVRGTVTADGIVEIRSEP
jgi:flagella basal body P-ring formation protein FlgA